MGVVADDIEVVLATRDLRAVDVCDEDRLALRLRPRQQRAKRIDDAAATATQDRVRVYHCLESGLRRRSLPNILELLTSLGKSADLSPFSPDFRF